MKNYVWSAEWRDEETWQLISPMALVKIDTGPTRSCQSTPIHCLNSGTQWVPGKSSWDEMKITYDDIDNDEGGALLFSWMSKQFSATDFWKPERSTVILKQHSLYGVLGIWYLESSLISYFDVGETNTAHYQLNVTIKFCDVTLSTPDPFTWLKPII